MNIRKLPFILALAVLVLSPLALSAESDAAVSFGDTPVTVSTSFDDMGAGAVTVHLTNSGTDAQTVTITVMLYPSDVLATASDVLVPAAAGEKAGEAQKELKFGFDSSGEKYLQIKIDDGVNDPTVIGYTLTVSHSIWKDSSTYILIIIVIAVIAIVVYLRMRGTSGKKTAKQPSKTFTEMEAEKRGGTESKQSGGSTRQRYDKGDKQK